MSERTLHVFPDLDALSAAAADFVAGRIAATPADGRFMLVLSGGGTPRRMHQVLADRYRDSLPWPRVHLFWGDERLVPPDDAESNYRMARETLLAHVPVPPAHVHRIPTDGTAAEAAAAYEARLHELFGPAGPAFDLTLLGLGDDGHTASLFPEVPALQEQTRWATAVRAPGYMSVRERVTLTYPALNRSREVLFLVAGAGKHATLRRILDDPAAPDPAAAVTARDAVHWFVDAAAYDVPEAGPTA